MVSVWSCLETRQNYSMKTGNKSLEKVGQFRCLGNTLKIKITYMKKLR
jgi:hypothetical protein